MERKLLPIVLAALVWACDGDKDDTGDGDTDTDTDADTDADTDTDTYSDCPPPYECVSHYAMCLEEGGTVHWEYVCWGPLDAACCEWP